MLLCGITGHKQFASDCGLLLRPDQTVAVAAAMVRVFAENGDRTDRKKARLKYLVDRWGVEKFLSETEKRLAFPLIRVPADACEPRRPSTAPHTSASIRRRSPACTTSASRSLSASFPSRRCSRSPTSPSSYGTGELRLTVWQNLIMPNIASANLEAAKQAILDCWPALRSRHCAQRHRRLHRQ